MKNFSILRRFADKIEQIRGEITETKVGIVNQSSLLNDKLSEIIGNSVNEQRIINDKLSELIEVSRSNQSAVVETLVEVLRSLDNEQRLLNDKLSELISSGVNEQRILNDKLGEVIQAVANQQALLNDKFCELIDKQEALADPFFADDRPKAPPPPAAEPAPPPPDGKLGLDEALRQIPLVRAPNTYNTDHPDYDPSVVRNFPGQFLNANRPCDNPVLGTLRELARDGQIDEAVWDEQLRLVLEELQNTPGARQLFERKEQAERYFADINRQYEAHYQPGWVNLDDALFLYWLVRQVRPRTIVETGVCNGFSAGTMVMALANNDDDGTLHAVGIAEVFNGDDARWTEKNKVYGEVVVGGHGLGWMVPSPYQHWVKFYEGDSRKLLPPLVDKLDAIDLFFHDSDHSYDHMMFEFNETGRKLARNAIVVSDNIGWNSSLWDFADARGAPAYNFRGSVGVVFL